MARHTIKELSEMMAQLGDKIALTEMALTRYKARAKELQAERLEAIEAAQAEINEATGG